MPKKRLFVSSVVRTELVLGRKRSPEFLRTHARLLFEVLTNLFDKEVDKRRPLCGGVGRRPHSSTSP